MNPAPRISHRSVGLLDAKAWFDEGDGLLASAEATRALWKQLKDQFRLEMDQRPPSPLGNARKVNELKGLPRASMLLLGYSVEMYLKAGLAKAYHGCSEEMFRRDVRSLYRHNLIKAAREIEFQFAPKDEANFGMLKDMILTDARYPIEVSDPTVFIDSANSQTFRIWSEKNFTEL